MLLHQHYRDIYICLEQIKSEKNLYLNQIYYKHIWFNK